MDLLALLRLLVRRWAVVLPLMALTVAVAWLAPRNYQGPVEASVLVLLVEPPPVPGAPGPAAAGPVNPYLRLSQSLAITGTVFETAMNDPVTAARLAAAGFSGELEVDVVDLTPGIRATGVAPPSPLLRMVITTNDADATPRDVDLVKAEISRRLVEVQQAQANGSIDRRLLVTAEIIGQSSPEPSSASGEVRPTVAFLVVGTGLTLWGALVIDRRRHGRRTGGSQGRTPAGAGSSGSHASASGGEAASDRPAPAGSGLPPGSTATLTGRSRPAPWPAVKIDAATMLSLYLVLLMGVPSVLVVKPLGAAGSPATILGILLAGWWTVTRLVPGLGPTGRQPIRLTVGLFVAAVGISYATGVLRGLDGLEQRAADRGVLAIVSVAGVALVAADGITSRARLDVVLQWLVRLGAYMSVIGLVQFQTNLDIRRLFRYVPGLSFNNENAFLFNDGVRRVASTAGHPIEFGMALTLIVPVAMYRAFRAPDSLKRRYWGVTALIGLAIPLSISRSAVVGLVAGAVVLVPTWSRPVRRQALRVLPVFLVVARLVAPGALGTLRSGFTQIEDDPSVQGRTQDYAVVGKFIGERPYFGRAFATFLPDRYILLDNQYIGIVIELGFVGLIAVLALLFSAAGCAMTVRRRSSDPEVRNLAQTLIAAVVAGFVGMVTFDAFGFSIFTGLLFLLLGCLGALRRLTPEQEPESVPASAPVAAVPVS